MFPPDFAESCGTTHGGTSGTQSHPAFDKATWFVVVMGDMTKKTNVFLHFLRNNPHYDSVVFILMQVYIQIYFSTLT